MYTKQTWASGDTITAAKLNHIEDGIENAGGERFADYDFVILEHNAACTLLKGTFSDVKAKIIAQDNPVCGLFVSKYSSGSFSDWQQSTTMVVRYNLSGDNIYLYVTVQPFNDAPSAMPIYWDANSIYVD